MSTTIDDRNVSIRHRTDFAHERQEVLIRRALRAIEMNPYFRGRTGQLDLRVDDGRLTVKGRVPSFFLKQILQTLLNRVEGVEEVNNQVDVTPPQGVTH